MVVAVAGGIVLLLVAGAVRTLTAPDRYSASRGGSYDATVEQSGGRPRTSEIATLPAADTVKSATFVFGQLVPTRGRTDGANTLVFAGSQSAFGTRLVDGREPDPAAPDEFAATRSFVESNHASLGDHFDLSVIPQGSADALGFDAGEQAVRLLRGTLVGVIDGPSELQDGYALAIFPVTLLDAGDVGISATQSVVSLAPGSTVRDLRTQLDDLPDGSQFGIDRGDWVPADVRAAVRGQGLGLAVLAAIAGIATIVVVGQLLSRQVRRPAVERSALRAMGMTRNQIVGDSLLAAGVPTILGVAVALALAYIASSVFPTSFVRHVEPHPGRMFDTVILLPGAIAIAMLLLIWVLIAVVVSSRDRTRTDRPTVVDTVARHVPVEATTAIRFAFTRQPGDSAGPRAAIVGAVAVVGVLVAALTFGASLGELVDRPARWGDNFDVAVGQGGGELSQEIRTKLARDPDIAAVTLFGAVLTSVGSEGFDVTGLLPVLGTTAPPVVEGRLAERGNEIAVGRVFARRRGVQIGDHLVVVGPAGARRLRITGLAVLPAVEGADGVGEGGLVTFAGLRRLDPSARATAAGIRLRTGAPPGAAQRISARIGIGVGRPDRPGVILNVARVRSIPYLVAGVLAVLALLNLSHHLILSTRRRRRDLAILRALGASGRWVGRVVHWQATLFTALVVAIGTPLGIVAGRVVYRAFVDRIGAVNTVTVPFSLCALTIVGLVVLANIVAMPNAHRARRQNPAGLLAAE